MRYIFIAAVLVWMGLGFVAGLWVGLASADDVPCTVEQHKTWEPPTIPQCDKELWERIREGCDNE